ncbi:MAG: DUF5336 domain-containing protein [Pseudonocardia sp.]
MSQPGGAPTPPGPAPATPTDPADGTTLGSGPARLLALAAAGLAVVIYLLAFFGDLPLGTLVAGPLVLGGGLLAGASALPRAGRMLLPAAVVTTTGALLLLQVAVGAPSLPISAVITLVLAFLLAGACVAAVLLDCGLVTMPERKRRDRGPAGYGAPPPGYGGQYPGAPGYPPPGQYPGQQPGGYGRPGGYGSFPGFGVGDQTITFGAPGPGQFAGQPVPPSAPTRADGVMPEWYARPDAPPPTPAAGVPRGVDRPPSAGVPLAPDTAPRATSGSPPADAGDRGAPAGTPAGAEATARGMPAGSAAVVDATSREPFPGVTGAHDDTVRGPSSGAHDAAARGTSPGVALPSDGAPAPAPAGGPGPDAAHPEGRTPSGGFDHVQPPGPAAPSDATRIAPMGDTLPGSESAPPADNDDLAERTRVLGPDDRPRS